MSGQRLDIDDARDALYEAVRRDAPFEDRAERALELGESYLGTDGGYVVRVDPVENRWEALVSTDPTDGPYPAGRTLDLRRTYCRLPVEQDGPVRIHDATAQGLTDDPAFEAHGVHCYHGVPVTVDGEPHVVCFIGEDPREPFEDDEAAVAELVAWTLERELGVKREGRQRNRFRAVFEDAPDAMLVTDEDGRIVDANERAADLLDRSRSALLGRSVVDVTGESGSVAEVVGTTGEARGTIPVVRPDGTERVVEYATSEAVVADEHLVILRDVTERREREATLRRYRRVVEHQRDRSFLVDDSGRVTFVDDAMCRLLDSDRDAVVDSPVEEAFGAVAVDDADVGRLVGTVEDVLRERTEARVDLALSVDDGERVFEVRLTPYDPAGEEVGVVGVARDVTDRRDR